MTSVFEENVAFTTQSGTLLALCFHMFTKMFKAKLHVFIMMNLLSRTYISVDLTGAVKTFI